MIIRLVKMTFHANNAQAFEALFKERHAKIAGFEGCTGVELLKEMESNDTVVYFTRSRWIDDEDLQRYRQSDLFKDTWEKTKALFAGKPEAWSTKIVASQFED